MRPRRGFPVTPLIAVYGPDGTCWTEFGAEACRLDCRAQLNAMGVGNPDEAACWECESDSDCGAGGVETYCSLEHRCVEPIDACAAYCTKTSECCYDGFACGGAQPSESCPAECNAALEALGGCADSRRRMFECAVGLGCDEYGEWIDRWIDCDAPDTCALAAACEEPTREERQCPSSGPALCETVCACSPEACGADPQAFCASLDAAGYACQQAVELYAACLETAQCGDAACAYEATLLEDDC